MTSLLNTESVTNLIIYLESYAVEYSYKLAADTLILNTGLSIQDDTVKNFAGSFVDKKTPLLSAGLTRILDKFTSVTLNFSYSWPSGYLSDPYKSVYHEIFGDISGAPENRPDERKIFIFYSELSRYLDLLKTGIHLSYRYFQDNHNLSGNTFEIQANKRFGEKWVISPPLPFLSPEPAIFFFTTRKCALMHFLILTCGLLIHPTARSIQLITDCLRLTLMPWAFNFLI